MKQGSTSARLHAIRATLAATASAALGLSAVTPAGAVEYGQIVAEKSQIAFTSKQMGVPVDGRFKSFTADFAFDPAKPEAARGRIDIDLGSVDAGSDDANTEVKRKPWFDVASFPKASFVASKFKAVGAGKFEVTGKLTIKGRSQDLTAPLTVTPDGANARLDGVLTIKRLQFAIGEGTWSDTDTVADDVQVKFRLLAVPRK